MTMLRPLGLILLILLTSSSSVFGQPKGVALRDKNIILIHEDDKNIFNLVSTSVKPYQDTGYVFTFDLRQDYKVVDKTHPEDVGLNLRYMVFCDKQRIAPTMVQHSRGDGMLGMIDPPNFNGAIDMPEPGTYQRKVLDYVCNAQLGDGYKKIVVTTQAKQVPVTIPPPVLTSQNKSTVSPDGQAKDAPIQTDIGKLVVVYQPDADAYYPSFSKRSGEQGEVVVRLIIDEGGNVEEIALLKSSTFPRLDRAASDIGRRYHFKPYLVNGSPTRISTNLLIKFNLAAVPVLTPEQARMVLQKDPNNINALNQLGYYYADRNEQLTLAYDLLYQAHYLAPNDSNVTDSFGWVNYRQGKNEIALELLQKAFSQQPSAEKAAHLGEVLWKQGKFSEAQDIWRQGEKINLNDARLLETQKRLKNSPNKVSDASTTPLFISAAPAGWVEKVVKKIRPLVFFDGSQIVGNPATVVKVDLAPDGAILSTSILSSSGNAGWDRAVLLALTRAESLPKDDNGKIPQREVKLTFKPKD